MADLNIHKLHLTNQIREAEEQRANQRKKNVLVLVLQYLEENGYVQTAESLKSEANAKLDQFIVCDNINLELILQEFETFHYVKFQRQPQIVKKVPEDNKSCSLEKRKQIKKKASIPKLERVPNSSGTSNVPPLTGSRFQKEADFISNFTASPPKILANDEKNGLGELVLDGTGISNANINRKPSPEILMNDGESRLLRPLGAFPNYSNDWRYLAEFVSRDIYSENPNVHWDDIIGHERAKKLLKEAVVYPIKYPEIFASILSPWRGLLLYGPTGTGKTLLAKALATECQTTFFNVCASTLVSKWRGDSEKLVKVLFELARYQAPSTIFLDEVDSLMCHRGSQGGSEHEASRRMKAEFLAQMDGLASSEELVFVLAATNIPWELDYAMLRRLEKRILVSLPNEDERIDIFMKHIPPVIQKTTYVTILSDLDYDELGKQTEGYSGADIKLVCKESKMNCLRKVFELLEHVNSDGSAPKEVVIEPIKTSDVAEAISNTKPAAGALDDKYDAWQKEFGSI